MVDKEQLMMCSCDVINLINVLLCKLVAFLAIFFVLVTKYADGFTVGSRRQKRRRRRTRSCHVEIYADGQQRRQTRRWRRTRSYHVATYADGLPSAYQSTPSNGDRLLLFIADGLSCRRPGKTVGMCVYADGCCMPTVFSVYAEDPDADGCMPTVAVGI